MEPSGSGPSAKVLCKCRKRCGGSQGSGRMVGYSTKTKHLREDALPPSSTGVSAATASNSGQRGGNTSRGQKRRRLDNGEPQVRNLYIVGDIFVNDLFNSTTRMRTTNYLLTSTLRLHLLTSTLHHQHHLRLHHHCCLRRRHRQTVNVIQEACRTNKKRILMKKTVLCR